MSWFEADQYVVCKHCGRVFNLEEIERCPVCKLEYFKDFSSSGDINE